MKTVTEPATTELLLRLEAGVLMLTLNRPERLNALSPTLYDALALSLEQAAGDPSVGAVVLCGTGRAFCAGGDVKRMAQETPESIDFEHRVDRLRHRTRIVEWLHQMDKPTIAMLRGDAVGAGLSLALACDLRWGDESVRLRTGFRHVATSGDFGGHYFLPRVVGAAVARELFLTSPTLDAARSLELGLIHRMLPAAELEPSVIDMARGLASGPRTALAYLKRNLNLGAHASLAEVLDAESWRHVRCTETADHQEAVRAFAEKRPPRFRHHDASVQDSKQEARHATT